jgi:ABC-type glycerol-3-phosphate transport system permease component
MTPPLARRLRRLVLNLVVMPALALALLFPIIWMVVVSFQTEAETYATPLVWWPSQIDLRNYVRMWEALDFQTYFINTAIVAGATTILAILVSAPAGYALTRYRFRGAEAYGTFLLATQMFPRVVLIVPYFVLMRSLGLVNTYPALILIYVSFAAPFCVWMLRGHFLAIPTDLDEAALVDGCGPFAAFWRVVLPLTMPGVVATAMFAFLVGWNEFLFALVLTTDQKMSVITLGLASLIGEYRTQWNELMAATVVSSIPAIALYAVLERFLVAGLTAGATKG